MKFSPIRLHMTGTAVEANEGDGGMIIVQTGKIRPKMPSSETSQKQLIQIIIYYVRGHAYSANNIVDRKNVENVNDLIKGVHRR